MTTNKEINKNAKSNLAKLLATENISVEHKKVRTAYFDLKNRLLVVPIFKDMNKDILDLLLSHEIGHALFTDMNEWRIAVEEEKIPHSFLNVIEDARIEKLVKRKYPGLSQTFIRGYRDLIASNFFKTKDRNLDDMLLIDRLNMHFKSSFVESDIYFTEPELEIVDRMKNLETFDDVKKLAQELADYSNEEAETKQMNDIDEFSDDGEFDFDSEDSDEEGDSDYAEKENKEEENENEGNSETDTTSSESDNDKEEKQKEEVKDTGHNAGTQSDTITDESIPQEFNQVQPETDNAWQETSKELLDSKCKDNEYLNIHEYKNLKDYVVDYKEVLNDFRFSRIGNFKKDHMSYKTAYSKLLTDYKKFVKNQNKAVNYMVKEFEMKKAAHAYSRSKQDKSGVIDPLKLHGYKYNDDIFKRLTLLPDGKNHGLMMFIDWSGSMGDKISATIEQLMNLTMFCKKVQIPFEVYAFSNNTSYKTNRESYETSNFKFPQPVYENNDLSVDTHMILLNFVSSRMNTTEYEQGMINLHYLSVKFSASAQYYNRRRYQDSMTGEINPDDWKCQLHSMPRGYNMSSTPLNDCIMAAMKMVPAFQKKYNIDKMNTVFLTDGMSDGNERKAIIDSEEIKKLISGDNHYGDRNDTPTLKNKYLSSDTNHILVDKQTKKQTLLPTYYSREGLTDALLKALKERTHSKVIGFFIESRKRISAQTLEQYYPEFNHYRDTKKKTFNRQIVMAEFRKNKCLVVKDNTGYDELYLLAADNMKVEDGLMATPSENAKKGEIKRLFASTLKSNRQSRVVLNKFISQVA